MKSAPNFFAAALIALALAGCMECRPGDVNTINHRDLCPQHGEQHGNQ